MVNGMARHVYFDTRDSDCERFLSAPLWEEACGLPLSVMSAFARLGLEPWNEAERLRHMSRHGAESALAANLSRLPMIGANLPDYAGIATRLVTLLPEHDVITVGQTIGRARSPNPRLWWWLAAAGVALLLQTNGWLF